VARVCQCCGTADISHRESAAKYCLACRNGGMVGLGRVKATQAVNAEVRAGRMQRPGEFKCVDCGEPAECWEHRDYSRPLDVEPVCRLCNNKRGAGANNFHAIPACEEQNITDPQRVKATVYVGSRLGLHAFVGQVTDFYAVRSAIQWAPREETESNTEAA
jgi:hypothetical protein